MYVEIKEDKLLSWSNVVFQDAQYVDIDYATFNPEQYKVVNGELKDISATNEYKDSVLAKLNQIKKNDYFAQIDELDRKRIRAIAEPQLKDAVSGQTWLEYYTSQIQEIRAQIAAL